MKKSWDFTARDRDEYWQQLVPHDGSASSTRAAKMLVVLLNESSIKSKALKDENGFRLDILSSTPVIKASNANGKLKVTQETFKPVIVNQRPDGVSMVVKSENDGHVRRQFPQYFNEDRDVYPSLSNLPSSVTLDPDKFREGYRPGLSLQNLIDSPIDTCKDIVGYFNDALESKTHPVDSGEVIDRFLLGKEKECRMTLQSFLQSKTARDILKICSNLAGVLIDKVKTFNADLVLEGLGKSLLNNNMICEHMRVSSNDFPRALQPYLFSSFDEDAIRYRQQFARVIRDDSGLPIDSPEFVALFGMLTGTSNGSESDWTRKITEKVDRGEHPLVVIRKMLKLPPASVNKFKKALMYQGMMSHVSLESFKRSVALAFINDNIIGYGEDSVFADVPVKYRHAQMRLVEELSVSGRDMMRAEHNGDVLEHAKHVSKWAWLIKADDRQAVLDSAFRHDYVASKRRYQETIHRKLDVISQYVHTHPQNMNDNDGMYEVVMRGSPLMNAFDNKMSKLPIPLFSKLEANTVEYDYTHLRSSMRPDVPEVDFPCWQPGKHCLSTVAVSQFSCITEALNGGVDFETLSSVLGHNGNALFKVESQHDGQLMAILQVSLCDDDVVDIALREIEAIERAGKRIENKDALECLNQIVEDPAKYGNYLFDHCDVNMDEVSLSIADLSIMNCDNPSVLENEVDIYLKKVNAAPELTGFNKDAMKERVGDIDLYSSHPSVLSSVSDEPFYGLAGVIAAFEVDMLLPVSVELPELLNESMPYFSEQVDRSLIVDEVSALKEIYHSGVPLERVVDIALKYKLNSVSDVADKIERDNGNDNAREKNYGYRI